MPHPLRALGKPVYSVFVKLWGDDVSGNRTKQWNKHFNWYFQHAGIPSHLLHQEYFVRFASTSPDVSILDQASVIVDQLKYCLSSWH